MFTQKMHRHFGENGAKKKKFFFFPDNYLETDRQTESEREPDTGVKPYDSTQITGPRNPATQIKEKSYRIPGEFSGESLN